MSEPTARPAAPPKGAGGKKILGVNRTTAIVFGVALFAALAWALYKRSKAAKTATTATTPANASGECTDANGNSTVTPPDDQAILQEFSSNPALANLQIPNWDIEAAEQKINIIPRQSPYHILPPRTLLSLPP